MNTETPMNFSYRAAIGRELRRLLRQPLVLVALLLQVLLIGWLQRGQLQRYLELQAGGIGNRSVGDDLMVPVLGAFVAALLLTAPLVAAAQRAALLTPWRRLAAAPDRQWLLPALLAGTLLLLLPVLTLLAVVALLRFGSAVSLWPLLSSAIALILLAPALLWGCLWLGVRVRALSAALALGYLAMVAVAGLELQSTVQTPLGLFRVFREGALPLAGLLALPLLLLSLLLAFKRFRRQPTRAGSLPLLLACVLAALISSQLPWRWQPATSQSLSATDQAIVAALTEPARLLVVSADPDRRRDYLAQLAVLAANQPKLQLDGFHPDELPISERDSLPGREGLLISMAGQSIWLKLPLAELAQFSARSLGQLQRRQQRFLVFLEGHGERRLFSDQNNHSARDLGALRQRLDELGIRALPLRLGAGSSVPANTAALVLASPTSALLPEEWQAMQRYLDGGGALLWLREPDEPADYQMLADYLGVQREPGTVLDLAGSRRGTPHPAIALVEQYPAHPALRGIDSLTALPWAAALRASDHNGFVVSALLQSSADSVRVDDANAQSVPLDAPRGPFTLGVALSRALGDHQQRIVVLGDGHFLADSALANYGNSALAIAVLQWLSVGDEALATADDRPADADLLPPIWLMWLYQWGIPVLLPLLLLLLVGGYQWRWRRQ